jgi:phospholipase D1/2
MASGSREDPLAYGDYHPHRTQGGAESGNPDSDRGLLGNAYQKLRSQYQPQQPGPNTAAADLPQAYGQNNPSTVSGGTSKPSAGLLGSSIFDKLHGVVHGLGAEVKDRLTGRDSPTPAEAQLGHTQDAARYRYGSFARPKGANDVKWYVDGCGYMWAVSRALEQARESIWILDCEINPLLTQ